jgi:hypothetical protein
LRERLCKKKQKHLKESMAQILARFIYLQA